MTTGCCSENMVVWTGNQHEAGSEGMDGKRSAKRRAIPCPSIYRRYLGCVCTVHTHIPAAIEREHPGPKRDFSIKEKGEGCKLGKKKDRREQREGERKEEEEEMRAEETATDFCK